MAGVPYDAIVLAGGSARRLDGADKPALDIGGLSLLARAVTAVDDAGHIVVVGPPRPLDHDVVWVREQPPGGGPVAAVAAGVAQTSADVIVVLASDLPWVGPAVPVLRNRLGASPVAMLVDPSDRVNHLAAAWRRDALIAAIETVGPLDGAAMRALVAVADDAGGVVLVPDTHGWGRDCDTWDDVAAARAAVRRG